MEGHEGIESDEDEEDEDEDASKKGASASGGPSVSDGAAAAQKASDDDSEDDDDDDVSDKPKGVAHLIDIENPNHVVRKTKKVTELNTNETTLSRREREELEKQHAKEHYTKMHLAGKTDEARADLARLALIKKQREDAAKKRDEEKKAQDDAKAAAEKRLLEKKTKAAVNT